VFALAIALPAAANAAAPTGLTVQLQQPYKLFAQWTLPPGTDSHLLEIATSPDTGQDGSFKHVVISDPLTPAQMSDTPKALPQGTYWVHVSGVATGCGVACVDEFTGAVEVTIPTPPAPVLESVGQVARNVTATWSLDPGLDNEVIEVATSPETYPEGEFLIENTVLIDLLDPGVTNYTSSDPLPAGVYYVHVGASDPSCPIGVCPNVFSNVRQLGIPPDPEQHPVATQSLPKPRPDTVTDFSALKCASTQKAGNLIVQASMLESGTITVEGTLSVPNAARIFKLRAVSVSVRANQTVRIKLKLPARALRAAKRALKRRRTVKARLTITARDGLGNTKSEKRAVKLKR